MSSLILLHVIMTSGQYTVMIFTFVSGWCLSRRRSERRENRHSLDIFFYRCPIYLYIANVVDVSIRPQGIGVTWKLVSSKCSSCHQCFYCYNNSIVPRLGLLCDKLDNMVARNAIC